MKLSKEQETVCNVFSRRDVTGHVHCHDCPMVIDKRSAICIKTVAKEKARIYHDWNGSPYPALGEYKGGQDGHECEN